MGLTLLFYLHLGVFVVCLEAQLTFLALGSQDCVYPSYAIRHRWCFGFGEIAKVATFRVSGSGFKVRTGFRRGWVKDWVVSRDGVRLKGVGGKNLRVDLDLSKLAIGLQKANQIKTLDYSVSEAYRGTSADDEASNHEDASDTGVHPKQNNRSFSKHLLSQISKTPNSKKEEYDFMGLWEMEHYHWSYIDN
ncbi:hypothetical protein Tco_0117924 [Tanacetum coccineum]